MIRLGQIGVGAWGKNLLRNFTGLSDCDVTWICDISDSVQDRVRKSHPKANITPNANDLYADPDLDAVVIATPAPTHADIAIGAIEAGKHVFVEKPMALNVADAKRLVDAAAQSGTILMVGHLLEYHPAFTQVKGMIEAGELGDIHYLYSTRVNLGKVREDENAMWSLAPHDISIALMMIDDDPVSVTCTGHAYLQPDIEDVAFMSICFKGGCVANVHVSWLDPHKVRKLTIVGSKTMVVVDDMEPSEMIRVYDKGVNWTGQYKSYGEALTLRVGDIHIPHVPMTEPLQAECQTYLDAINTGQPPPSDGNDGLRVVKVLAAADESMRNNGTPIEIT
jgi:predicted dehydrogenase